MSTNSVACLRSGEAGGRSCNMSATTSSAQLKCWTNRAHGSARLWNRCLAKAILLIIRWAGSVRRSS